MKISTVGFYLNHKMLWSIMKNAEAEYEKKAAEYKAAAEAKGIWKDIESKLAEELDPIIQADIELQESIGTSKAFHAFHDAAEAVMLNAMEIFKNDFPKDWETLKELFTPSNRIIYQKKILKILSTLKTI